MPANDSHFGQIFQVPSQSKEDVVYSVDWDRTHCSCPGFCRDGIEWCKHLAAVSRLISEFLDSDIHPDHGSDPISAAGAQSFGSVTADKVSDQANAMRKEDRHIDVLETGGIPEDLDPVLADEISRLVDENFGIHEGAGDGADKGIQEGIDLETWTGLLSSGDSICDDLPPQTPTPDTFSSLVNIVLPPAPPTTFISTSTITCEAPLDDSVQPCDEVWDKHQKWSMLVPRLRMAGCLENPDLSNVPTEMIDQLNNALWLITGPAHSISSRAVLPSRQKIPPNIKSTTETARVMPSIKRKAPSQYANDPYAAGEKSGKKVKKAHLPSFEARQHIQSLPRSKSLAPITSANVSTSISHIEVHSEYVATKSHSKSIP
jgi:hypothetical protein